MDPSVPSLRRSSPGYDVKASLSGDALSSDGIFLQAESNLDHEKHPSSTDNAPSRIDVSDQAVPGLQDHSTQCSKRKTVHSPLGVQDTEYNKGKSKRLKLETGETQLSHLPRDKTHLPSEIWHHIFTFVPTRALGVLLQVNKIFNGYLDPRSPFRNPASLSECSRCVKPLKADAIWQLSRRLHWPKMPAPLRNRSELDMWRLCCSNVCQRCGVAKPSQQRQESPDPRRLGPGLDGLAAIFAFGVTCCGICLLEDSVKEIDLLLSSTTPSSLIPVLAHVVVTSELQVVPPIAVASVAIHEIPETTKLYSVSSIESAKKELRAAQDLGTAAVEEWLKGLEARGKELRSDSSRWERWTVAGGLVLMNQPLKLESRNETNGLAQVPKPTLSASVRTSPRASTFIANQKSQQDSSLSTSSLSTGHQLDSPANMDWSREHQGRPERNCIDTAALKALRRVEIERRAMQIDPPLPPNLLIHMPCFQTAIRMAAPMDDNAWSMLMPKLLAQRADAERTENEALPKGSSASVETNDGLLKEVTDKDWDDIQGPVRTQMSKYADEIIRSSWGKGRKVNKENSPRFAAEVLLSVRARFYADVAQDAAAAIAAGKKPVADPPEGPFTQKLTLENMKWVFDMKIKHHTESYRKELFLCNGCDSNRFYGFEGVIQHYAAKHTKALSLGNVVVHWRAEWPEQSPFKPSARPNKHSQQSTSHVPQNLVAPGHPSYSAYNALHFSGNMPPAPPYHFLPGHAPPSSYPSQHADPYLPPPPYHMDSVIPPVPYPVSGYGISDISQTYVTPPTGFGPYPSPHGPPEYPPGATGRPYPGQPHHAAPIQGSHQPPYIAAEGMPLPPSYHAQMEDLARSARDLWNALSSIRDLPGPLRVYVTIHHVVKRFRSRFSEAPSLRMFNAGLSNNKEMRPVRNINGLMCKSCTLGLGPSVNPDRKTFSLPQLVNHFENRHLGFSKVDYRGQPGTDWTQDMVLLPEVSEMPDLRAILGNKGHKFNLIHEAVPWAFNKPRTPYRPSDAWPSTCDRKPDVPHHSAEYSRHSQMLRPASRGNQLSDWPDVAFTQDSSNVSRGQYVHRQSPSFGCEDGVAAVPHEPFFDNHQTRDPRSQCDPPSSDAHQSGAWNGPSRSYGQSYDNLYYKRDSPKGTDTARHRMIPHGLDRPYFAEGRRFAHEQPRAPGPALAESRSEQYDRYCLEEEHEFHASGGAGSMRTRPALERTRLPQDRQLSLVGSVTRVLHSANVLEPTPAGPSLEEPNDFNLTAALESHIAQDHDVQTQEHKSGPKIRDSGIEVRKDVAHKFRQPTHYAYQQRYMEVTDDVRQGRSSRQARDPYRIHRPGDSYEAAYTRSPATGPGPGRAEGRRETAHTYTDEMRTSPVQYEEAYEIVHVRDAEGEYVIRRPILREREPPRTLFEDDHCRRTEQETYPPSYGTMYASAGREASPGEPPAPSGTREASAMPPRIRNDPSFYEEYDPRNPAPVPRPSAARDFCHGRSS
ncbi:f-box domain containing protein [Colletotrichum incanum]|uniref:F-box domain containing protein n=1 Tax=Colletotrichum incanum TaxID=1573173 RepID=A0A162Q6J5_COLIC|nr:f-box domain containing protein [Colletotrichum incanum]